MQVSTAVMERFPAATTMPCALYRQYGRLVFTMRAHLGNRQLPRRDTTDLPSGVAGCIFVRARQGSAPWLATITHVAIDIQRSEARRRRRPGHEP
jgi:hypothetical protein